MITFKFNKLFAVICILTVFGCSKDDNTDPPPPASSISASNFTASIEENPTAGFVLGTVQATAGQGVLNYSITSQTPNGALAINATTGELSIANNDLFDYETNSIIEATVSVADDAGTATALATINLTNIKDLIYVHTATAANTIAQVTTIDHPDLNGNPDAKIVFSHNWNDGTYNDNVTGIYYDGANWAIFNEDISNIVEGSTYNVYIAKDDAELITHVATAANQGSLASYTVLDHPLLNGNPNANIVLSNNWSPNQVYNTKNYGVWYDESPQRWIIFDEAIGTIPTNAAFNVLIQGDTVTSFKHQATAANIDLNYTIIDHPSLNNNPNATFVFSHNWGLQGDITNVVLDKKLSLWYTGTNWSIYTEDQTNLPENISFDIVVTEN